jgi:hypothetical protein
MEWPAIHCLAVLDMDGWNGRALGMVSDEPEPGLDQQKHYEKRLQKLMWDGMWLTCES